ncbi:thioesterase family protein [Caldalkalibacillus salinus]|uniref:thioesterase family protein n=1 Tax=Caldalkalibacillus salinus TaxID=2803787 RepID=UPI0019243178
MKHISFIEPDVESWLDSFHFETTLKVRFSETDAFGHVNNVSHIIYFEQARLDYFEDIGVFSAFLDPAYPTMVVAADIHCHYVGQMYFNQRLKVKVKSAKVGTSSLDLHYAIVDEEDNMQVLAVARGAIVHVHKSTGKSTPWSLEMKEKVLNYEKV